MLPVREHLEESCSRRQGDDTVRRHLSPTEPGRTCTALSVFWTDKGIGGVSYKLRKKSHLDIKNFLSGPSLEVYITQPCPTVSKVILVMVMDNPESQ